MVEKRQVDLGKGNIPQLMFKLAIPAVMAQVINVLYSLVDRIYIGNIPEVGSLALTGLGVCFPILMVVSAFSAFVGFGGAPQASIKMGEGDNEGAQKILGTGVMMLAFVSVVISVLLFIFKEPLLLAFGASENTIEYANSYLSVYIFGTIFVQFALGLNPFISCQGRAKTAMFSVLIGAILNTILDPIFIFGFKMGVSGAALATIISQGVSCLWVLKFLTSKKSILRIRIKNLRLNPKIAFGIAALGIAPFVMQASESLVGIILNRTLREYGGDMHVGAMTIILSTVQLFIMPINGFAQGVTPITSFNFGAKNMERVKKTVRLLIIICASLTVFAWIIIMLFPTAIARLFTPDLALIELAGTNLRITMGCIFAFGITIACQTTFLALGQAKLSLFVAMLRKIILLIPLAMILPLKFGVTGVYAAQPIADFASALTCVTLFIIFFKKILDRRQNEKVEI